MTTAGVDARELAPPVHLDDKISQPVAIPALSLEAEAAISEAPSVPIPEPDVPTSSQVATPSEYALDPTPPSAVERVLQAVSGWPARLIPFMVQNIGWFIGGFCFVAGSGFLVSYTTGFTKALTIFTVLFAYTGLVLWAGYRLCRQRPELVTSSRVLMTIGVLLVPLNIAAAVRLIVTGLPAAGAVALGCLAVALCLGGLYYAITLVSGIVDRTLQGRHPQLFLSLVAMQLAVPLLMLWPSWPTLAFLHTMLLGLLIYGFVRFLPGWLHAIFIEHRNTTYYAAGTLVYAALVSFIHLTWGYQDPLALPPGYYGPFLILLCGVLFYVDAQLKQWVKRDAFLSRLSFAVYGVSILALFAGVGNPTTQVMTLSLAIILYARVMWQYATLPPLYVLLGCSAWLYHTVVLSKVPFAGYFLASVPGLIVLYIGSWRALRLQSPVLAQMSFRIWTCAVLGLAGWSLSHAQPGWVPMATSLMVMALAFLGPRYMPTSLIGCLSLRRTASEDIGGHGYRTAWNYVGMLAAVVATVYAPRWLDVVWGTQLAIGWLVVAELWTLIGWRYHRISTSDAAGTEPWWNGALLTIALVLMALVGFGDMDTMANRSLPLLLALSGGVLFQISWLLGLQWLFYGALLCWGAAGLAVKLTYFPESSSGTTTLATALAIWSVLWWIERIPPDVMTLLRERAEMRRQAEAPPVLLGFWSASYRPYPDIIRRPLELAMLLLGTAGLVQVGRHLLTGELEWRGVVSTSLSAVLVLLVTGRFHWGWLLPLAVGLGLGSGLATAYKLGVTTAAGLSFVGTLYALGAWRVGCWLLTHPLIIYSCRLGRLRGNRQVLEWMIYWSAFVITFLSLLVPLGYYGLFIPRIALLYSLVASMGFLWLSGQRYRRRLPVYLLLGLGAFSTVLCYLWRFYVEAEVALTLPINRWATLATDPGLGLTLLLTGLGMWGISLIMIHHLRYRQAERAGVPIDVAQHLYLTPLRVVAVGLALTAIGQQLGVAWFASFERGDTSQLLSVGVLGLSSIALLLVNHGLGKPAISCTAILGGVFTLLWAQGLSVHGSPVCSVGLLEQGCTDQWFTLALIAGVMAYLAHYLGRDPSWERLYGHPLYLVATAAYLWALLARLYPITQHRSSRP